VTFRGRGVIRFDGLPTGTYKLLQEGAARVMQPARVGTAGGTAGVPGEIGEIPLQAAARGTGSTFIVE
jgi:hypothetical protein